MGCLLGQLDELLHFFGVVYTVHVLDGLGTVCGCCHHFICMRDGGPRNILVAELCRVCEPFASGGLDVAPMCAIVLRQRCQVPAINEVVRPCSALVYFFCGPATCILLV